MLMYVWLVGGFVLLIKGADYFVEASSSIARALRVPSIIIGLTIVAFGTSAPELAVSTTASLAGSNEIAVGNVIGSNLFNLLVVLGCCGVIRPFAVQLRWDYAASVGVALVLFFMIFRDHFISRPEAVFLLLLFVGFLVLTVRDARANRIEEDEEIRVLSPLISVIYIGSHCRRRKHGCRQRKRYCSFLRPFPDSCRSDRCGTWHFPAGACYLRCRIKKRGEWAGSGQCHRLQYL